MSMARTRSRQVTLATLSIILAMNNVQLWLEKLRTDAKQIVAMTDNQLAQPAAFDLLNDMVVQANHAYVGNIDPVTGEMLQGVTWIHDQLQTLATLTVTQYIAGVSPPEIVPNPNNAIAFSTASEVKNK